MNRLMSKIIVVISFAILSGLLQAVSAEDRLQLDEANIQGASELPKVLYIVPWKKAEIGDKPVKVNRRWKFASVALNLKENVGSSNCWSLECLFRSICG